MHRNAKFAIIEREPDFGAVFDHAVANVTEKSPLLALSLATRRQAGTSMITVIRVLRAERNFTIWVVPVSERDRVVTADMTLVH